MRVEKRMRGERARTVSTKGGTSGFWVDWEMFWEDHGYKLRRGGMQDNATVWLLRKESIQRILRAVLTSIVESRNGKLCHCDVSLARYNASGGQWADRPKLSQGLGAKERAANRKIMGSLRQLFQKATERLGTAPPDPFPYDAESKCWRYCFTVARQDHPSQ